MKRFDADMRTIREAAQISQSQFAKLIGVKPTITDYVFVRSLRHKSGVRAAFNRF